MCPASRSPLSRIKRLEGFFDRRTLVADIAGSGVFEAGIGGAGAEDLAQLVETNLLANIELDQDQHRAAQGGVRRLERDEGGQRLGWNFTDGRGA